MTRPREDEVANSVIFEADLDAFLAAAEDRGLVEEGELETLAFEHDLDDEDLRALRAELAAREVEISRAEDEEAAEDDVAPVEADAGAVTTTDSLTLFMGEIGRHKLLTAAEEVELAKRIERGD